jgi:hypothetical protein
VGALDAGPSDAGALDASVDVGLSRRALVAMASEQLARTGLGRLANGVSIAVGLFVALGAVAVRVLEGSSAALGDTILDVARVATWTGAFGIGLAASSGRTLGDRTSGHEALALASGASLAELRRSRVLGGAQRAVRTMLLPIALVAGVTLVCAGSLRVVLIRIVVVALASLYALLVGSLVGASGAWADALAPRRGAAAFAGSWLGLATIAAWSGDPRFSLDFVLIRAVQRAVGWLGAGAVP